VATDFVRHCFHPLCIWCQYKFRFGSWK